LLPDLPRTVILGRFFTSSPWKTIQQMTEAHLRVLKGSPKNIYSAQALQCLRALKIIPQSGSVEVKHICKCLKMETGGRERVRKVRKGTKRKHQGTLMQFIAHDPSFHGKGLIQCPRVSFLPGCPLGCCPESTDR
jgi:hypothetical protein